MSNNNTIFNQLLNFIPKTAFKQFVGQHNGDRYTKKLTTWNQFVALMYAQATRKESLREIETGFNTHQNCWYHLGVKSVSKSSLSRACKQRDYQIFEKLFYTLLQQCKDVVPEKKFSFTNPLYSLDATTIQLCLSLFDWAKYTQTKGALKLHTLIDNKTMMPQLIVSSDGKKGDVTAGKEMNLSETLKNGSIVVFDRAYVDYSWWKELDDANIFFVSRAKSNMSVIMNGKHAEPTREGILADEKIYIGDYHTQHNYPKLLRRVRFFDFKTKKEYIFITNNFDLSASEIALIYKERWQIELFFKWIKQNLKIKTFLGTSENAVLTQIWVAMIYYLLLAYIKFQTKFSKTLLELTRMIRETLLIKRNLIDLLSLNEKHISKFMEENPQMSFF